MSDYEAWDQETLDAAGLRIVGFVGGTLDGQTRLIRARVGERVTLNEGDTYNRLVPEDETWVYRDGYFHLDESRSASANLNEAARAIGDGL